MARELKSVVLALIALVLSVVLMFSVVQGRPLCAPPVMVDPTGATHYVVDNVIGLWGIKSSGPSPPGAGH
ncbi:hypothetical protein PanWU01x14_341340 [Parasponia andersonii]|uniref:Transmembrane protein n=1 Tax=Parasponia andersonii TaxID=3476 RepID=A0A2P5AE14_PARAD|nr:hypothetical protein PanWU01x14_341340 [Parasponia andersonii]